jgi:hypothetical protein
MTIYTEVEPFETATCIAHSQNMERPVPIQTNVFTSIIDCVLWKNLKSNEKQSTNNTYEIQREYCAMFVLYGSSSTHH